jgi:hypothetical protein
VRLLGDEVDRLTVDVDQRSAGVANKASFLAVSAGVLLAASTSQLWAHLPWVGAIALLLACVGLSCAAVALRPGKRFGLVAQRLTDRYLDTTSSALAIEEAILREKSTIISRREDDLGARANWVLRGFGALILSAVALTVVFTVQLLGG